MEIGRTNLTEAVRSVHHLKIEGYSATRTGRTSDYMKSRWNVGGYDWEVSIYHAYTGAYKEPSEYWMVLKLQFLSEPRARQVNANLGCRLLDPSRNLEPSETKSVCSAFIRKWNYSSEILLMRSADVPSSGYLKNDSLIVECTITVLKQLPQIVIPAQKDVPLLPVPVPSSDLHRHLGALLQSQKGGDVTFILASGERFLVHKCILAARSPVFMAAFFGHMNEKRSQCVQIEGVEAVAFKAMLHFIYTDTVPELDDETEKAVTMAQHLLAAADRYGLDRLKLICEGKLSGCIDVDTAATTLALAEQHNCSLLRAKCVDFITASPEKLDAVLATEGYKHLVASCPFVLTELLKAAHGRRN